LSAVFAAREDNAVDSCAWGSPGREPIDVLASVLHKDKELNSGLPTDKCTLLNGPGSIWSNNNVDQGQQQ
jgi:hypothetical protein